jgi:light-regulated signal transduction histidine kinase (bacteriophytochrome)
MISHDSIPTILADQNQMLQVFQNLITNAIKFHGQNPPEIHISPNNNGKKWIFSIADNGIGMSPEHLERIFTIFQRLHSKDEYEGIGIGLAIAQKIVHQHGGQIWAESEPGTGSTFYFTIPIYYN